jgi:hypothetical protein
MVVETVADATDGEEDVQFDDTQKDSENKKERQARKRRKLCTLATAILAEAKTPSKLTSKDLRILNIYKKRPNDSPLKCTKPMLVEQWGRRCGRQGSLLEAFNDENDKC